MKRRTGRKGSPERNRPIRDSQTLEESEKGTEVQMSTPIEEIRARLEALVEWEKQNPLPPLPVQKVTDQEVEFWKQKSEEWYKGKKKSHETYNSPEDKIQREYEDTPQARVLNRVGQSLYHIHGALHVLFRVKWEAQDILNLLERVHDPDLDHPELFEILNSILNEIYTEMEETDRRITAGLHRVFGMLQTGKEVWLISRDYPDPPTPEERKEAIEEFFRE